MKYAAILLAFATCALAQQPEWAQCGGIGWTGGTTCAAGLACIVSNPYYSQCLPGPSTSSSTVIPSTTTTTTRPPTTTTTTSVSPPPPASTGFVKTGGQKFSLNGADYVAVGTNAYWLAQVSNTDIDAAFAAMVSAGFTTCRTWGFNEVTSASGTYYQIWSNGVPTLNTGSTGLGKFDYVVQSAAAHGIRLIVALTNNWSDYGGMDVYVSQLNPGGTHDTFYTDATIISAYKNYVNGFVSRYASNPTILGWELANEPRCGGSTGSPSASCDAATLTTWIKTMSAYIKSIDSNHLVAVGDEGWINSANPPSYPYQGNSIGIDFAVNLNISSIDFGTFHLYPESWGQTANVTGFGTQWITDHITFQMQSNKPVILEEFGVTDNQATVYQSWWNTLISGGLTGDLIWQVGVVFPDGSMSAQDGYAIFPSSAVYPIQVQAASQLKARG